MYMHTTYILYVVGKTLILSMADVCSVSSILHIHTYTHSKYEYITTINNTNTIKTTTKLQYYYYLLLFWLMTAVS